MRRHMRLITAAIVALAGCTDSQSGGPTAPRSSADLLELADPISVKAFVTTGGVDVVFAEPVGDPLFTAIEEPKQHLSYNAKLLRDETSGDENFQGEFQAQVDIGIGDALVGLHGTIKCFVIQDNRALVIGMVTNINAPVDERLVGEGFGEGSFVQWISVDNGEGSDLVRDMQSAITPADPVCPDVVPLEGMPTESGNIQIHPAKPSN
jgi:hypothetical protein